jgi:hypothetical protein
MLAFFKRKKAVKFGEIAVAKGLASQSDIHKALEAQKEILARQNVHRPLGSILTENGVLTAKDVKRILNIQERPLGSMAWFAALFSLSR